MHADAWRRHAERIQRVLSRRIFFIVGAQKSGTTWLQRLLDAHPEVMCSGEGHFVDRAGVDLEKMMRGYADLMGKVAVRVYENKPYYPQPGREQFEFLLLSLAALMWGHREIGDEVKCIGDKTPRNAAFMPQLQQIFPEPRFIHIVRDGRDVLVSRVLHAQRVARTTPGMDEAAFSFEQRTPEYARDWAAQVGRAMDFASRNAAVCHLVRYEDLSAQPDVELAKVFEFLGVAADAGVVQACRDAASFEKLSGGRRRGEENPQAFLRKGISGDWQQHLSPEALDAFNTHAGPLLKRLRYT